MASKWRQQDYKEYQMTRQDKVICLLEAVAILAFFSYFFYRSIYPMIFIFLVYPKYKKYKKKILAQKQRYELTLQFKDMLVSLSGALHAGYSMENAIKESYVDMVALHGKESYITGELLLIMKGISNNQPVEKMLLSFGRRSGVEDIENFAQIIAIGKQSGGNINRITHGAIHNIEEKISVEQEIKTMLQEKKYELMIMKAVPFVLIFYIELTSKNYFNSLYKTMGGALIMTICLVVYLLAVMWSDKVLGIDI